MQRASARVRVWTPARDTYRVWILRSAVLTVVVIASGLRLWRPDLTLFEIDEAAILRLTEDLVRFGRVPLAGPVFSAGIPSAPHFLYLLAPVVAVSRDPAFVSGAIAAANVVGLIATLWLGWRAFGPLAGLVAGALYAVSPWAIFYARRIWQPDVLPPLAALLFIALDLAIVDRRMWWAAATFPIVSFAVAVHPSFAYLTPLLLAPAVVLVRARRWRPLVVGCVLAGLTTIPYVVHQLQTRWVDVANIRYYSSLHTWVDLASLRYALGLATGLGADTDPVAPPLGRAFPPELVQISAEIETALLLGAIVFGLLMVTQRRWPTERFQRLRLGGLLLWLLLPVLLMVRHSLPLQAHYFLALYPAPFLLIGAACAWLFRARRGLVMNVAQVGVASALAVIVAIQGAAVFRSLQYVASTQDACFGPLLPTARAAEREIVELGNRTASSRAAVELPAADSLPLAYLLRSDFPAVDLAGSGDIGLGSRSASASTWPSTQATSPILTTVQTDDLDYSTGVKVQQVAYSDQPRSDQRVTLAITWLVQPDAISTHAFVWDVALVDAAGNTVFRKSGVDHILATLRGQQIVSWLTLDPTQTDPGVLVPGTYHLRLQLIDAWGPDVVPFTDAHSQQTSDTLELGPIAIAAPVGCIRS